MNPRRDGIAAKVTSLVDTPRMTLLRLRDWWKTSATQRRTAKARARFWAELREGECEAETRARS